jgi:hypothetical protein
MNEGVWTYRRGAERLVISREETDSGANLVISGTGTPRSYAFADPVRLVDVQADMESFLLRTGWTFAEFSPDRREQRDRRLFPRETERRRWWTDGSSLQWSRNSKSCSGIRNPSNT